MATTQQTRQTATDLVAEGRQALLGGEKARARALLQIAVRDQPDNVEAWLWLSGTHTQHEQIEYCLRQVLAREPDNPQALEGLAWLDRTFATTAGTPAASPASTDGQTANAGVTAEGPASPRPATLPYTRAGLPVETTSSLALVESTLHVVSVGAMIGLLRLLGAVRPGTLLLLRGSSGSLSLTRGLVIAAIVAALHALALLVIWVILGRTLSRQRNDRQGDLFDSLVRATTLLTPAYITGLALVLVAASVNFSERRWLPIVVTVWALLLGALALSLRRLRRLLDTMRVARRQRGVHVARILVPVLIAGILGIGLAGLAMQVLLRQ
jgi:hypothetical protein